VPAGFSDYWTAKGVVSGALGWQGWMYQIITGYEPMFYLKVSGSTYKLIDGLSWDFFLTEEFLRVSGDYPLGKYTFEGVIEDQIFETSMLSASVTFIRFNHAPVALDQSVSTAEDTELSVTLSATDIESDPLTYFIVTGPSHGTLSGSAPYLTYTPSSDYYGADSFTFKANDTTVDGNIATISIMVTAVNDAPVITGQETLTTPEDTALTVTLSDLIVTDVDNTYPNGFSLTLQAGTNYTLFGNTLTPALNFNGTLTVPVTVNDGLDDSRIFNLTVTVTAVNDAPVLEIIGNKSVDELDLLTFTVSGSDVDLPANTLTFSLVGAPIGTSINPSSGVFTWTPNEVQGPGSYPITFRVCDDATPSLCDQETITVTVAEVNSSPAINEIGDKATAELVLLTFTAVATDGDFPANILTFSLAGAPLGATINSTSGVFSWTPTEAQGPGSYIFTVKVCDDGTPSYCDQETITVTVSEVATPPLAVTDAYIITENTTLIVVAPGVLSNDTDSDIPANVLIAIKVSNPTNGTLTFNSDGSFTYTPNNGWYGVDSFVYKVNDGVNDSNVVAVIISVTPWLRVYLPIIGK